jgi:hypothetical protein
MQIAAPHVEKAWRFELDLDGGAAGRGEEALPQSGLRRALQG